MQHIITRLQQAESSAGLFRIRDGVPLYRDLPVEVRTFHLGGRTFEILALRDAADLLDHADFARRFIEEDKAPYGLELWPASVMLAEHVLDDAHGEGRDAVEIGAGLALPSLAATVHGWRVTVTDHDPIALDFAACNAELCGISLHRTEPLDWRNPPRDRAYERVFGADVLYQLVDHAPILRCIDALLADDGCAMLSDPFRGIADRVPEMAREYGFDVQLARRKGLNHAGKVIEGRIILLRRPSPEWHGIGGARAPIPPPD
jgi:predicted nicotinamide N-methyase